MEISKWQIGITVAVIYFTSIAIYRLYLSPIAHIPGPKLAALTRWYEGYYDVWQNGQYTFKIKELHKKYGPIIRISPVELHVNDSVFFEQLYRQDGHWDKYGWMTKAFAADGATILTVDHALHRARRQPLAPYFSKARITAHQDMIRKHMGKLTDRLADASGEKKVVNLGAAVMAFTRDMSNDFVLGKCYNSLDREDFDAFIMQTAEGAGASWRLTKHTRIWIHVLKAIPISFLIKYGNEGMRKFFRFLLETQQDTERLMAEAVSDTDAANNRSIVHEIMKSKLPASEKTKDRIFEDMSTVTGAGIDTTAAALRLILFNIYDKPEILNKLRAELSGVCSAGGEVPELKILEQLPYLTATITEGMRLSPAIATRMARISDGDLFYVLWRIPVGTPVGMTLVLMHTNESVYPNPLRYDPERWLDPKAKARMEKAYAPFSRGTRNCLGMQSRSPETWFANSPTSSLAWAEMYLIIATLINRFDFKYPDATAEDFLAASDQFAIGTKGKGNLNAVVSVRDSE
ncbi:cytochrome P450 [Xylariaceae sp. FL0255]|nr:cytochrome P450 [Xylariaceae sp. FL0255]